MHACMPRSEFHRKAICDNCLRRQMEGEGLHGLIIKELGEGYFFVELDQPVVIEGFQISPCLIKMHACIPMTTTRTFHSPTLRISRLFTAENEPKKVYSSFKNFSSVLETP